MALSSASPPQSVTCGAWRAPLNPSTRLKARGGLEGADRRLLPTKGRGARRTRVGRGGEGVLKIWREREMEASQMWQILKCGGAGRYRLAQTTSNLQGTESGPCARGRAADGAHVAASAAEAQPLLGQAPARRLQPAGRGDGRHLSGHLQCLFLSALASEQPLQAKLDRFVPTGRSRHRCRQVLFSIAQYCQYYSLHPPGRVPSAQISPCPSSTHSKLHQQQPRLAKKNHIPLDQSAARTGGYQCPRRPPNMQRTPNSKKTGVVRVS